MKVYEAIARAIIDEGTDTVFALLGDANMELLAALNSLALPSIRQSRHENAVVAQAQGYARAVDRPGVCMVTSGPGLANACLSLTESVRARSPMVLFTGQWSRDDRTNIQYFDHEALVRVTGAEYVPIASASHALDATRAAFHLARSRRVPVVVDVDIDVQDFDLPYKYAYEPAPSGRPQRMAADIALIRATVAKIDASQRPVILAGDGARRSGAVDALSTLAERIGALLSTTLPVRGLFDGDPYNVGVAGLFSAPTTVELLAEADLVLAVGSSLNHYTLEEGYLFPAAEVVHLDVSPASLMGDGQPPALHLQCDALTGVEQLLTALETGESREGFRTQDVAHRIAAGEPDAYVAEHETDRADPRRVCEALEEALPADVGFVCGVAHFWAFPIMHMKRLYRPQLFTHYFGAIGQALPVAAGASAACPDTPIVVIEGDGSLMMNVAELEGLAERNAKVLVIVMNDHALGAELHKLRAKGFDPRLGEQPTTDLAAVARSLGCRAVTVRDHSEMAGVVQSFLAADGPMLVDCLIARSVVSAPYRRLHFGTE